MVSRRPAVSGQGFGQLTSGSIRSDYLGPARATTSQIKRRNFVTTILARKQQPTHRVKIEVDAETVLAGPLEGLEDVFP
jgi:hypothetical protein